MNLLPPKLAAMKCGVAKSTFYVWAAEPGFPPARIWKGRRWWIDSEIDVWLAGLPLESRPQ